MTEERSKEEQDRIGGCVGGLFASLVLGILSSKSKNPYLFSSRWLWLIGFIASLVALIIIS
jgi:hypothetical protein